MTAADVTSVAHIRCPAPLRDIKGFLIWRFEENDNPGGKPRKVPYYAGGGRRVGQQGTPDDREQLVTFAAARAAAARRGMAGVGFAPLPEFGIVALDFDNCVTDGVILQEVADAIAGTYAEFSPSGKGIRAIFRGQLGNLKSHGEPYGLELFSSKGYVTLTGNVLPMAAALGDEDTIAPVDEKVLSLIQRRFKRELEVRTQANYESTPLGVDEPLLRKALEALPSDLDYDSWLQTGMAVHHETRGEGFDLWDEWSQRSPKYTSREYGLARWNSFGKHNGPAVTVRSLIHMANEHGADIDLLGVASPEDFDAVATTDSTPAKASRFKVESFSEFVSRPPPEWMVRNVLPRADLAVMYGEPGSGKSFTALDLAMAVARGIPWRGMRVEQGRVVYIVAEGAGGFRNRCAAYAQLHEIDVVPFDVIADQPNLLERKDALDVAKAIGKADLVVIDTFAQTTPGANENAAEDMGKALAHCRGIRRATGALVLLVHHSGKDKARGARGWSGIKGAVDAEIEINREPTGRSIRISKQKDGEDNQQWGFGLEVVQIGIDKHGDPITSCVVVEAEVPVAKILRALGPNEQVVNEVIQEFAKDQTAGIEVAAVIAESLKRMPAPEDGKRDTRKQRIRRAIETLTRGDDAPYWLADDGTLEVV